MKVIVACGGTGGHVFPGMMAAQALAQRGAEVAVLLTDRGIERAATEWHGTTYRIRCPKPRWKHPIGFFTSLFALASATRQACKLMRSVRPDALLAMGSYTSVGPVLAARLLRIPVTLHEGNVIPGSAVSLLSRLAHTVAISFEETRERLPTGTTIVHTGLPIRSGLAGAPPLLEKDERKTTLLVMGGSQGARALNERILAAFALMPPEERAAWRVIHLCGHAEETAVRNAYAPLCADGTFEAHPYAFLSEIGRAYAACDLCVSRAGTNACFELALCAVPAILVPLPTAARDHQTANARAFAAAGGALFLPQPDATPERLLSLLRDLRHDPQRRAAMASAMSAAQCAMTQRSPAAALAATVLRPISV
ncbi:MAG: UDP-N-acetylglucosamine--N-acetylmuramyl-(pentapeptide) pyrophosphoryl-undecaprenol N-acetylglucosamine transferase [Kiritimatiellaeota bacterium]|nr:UDP-N-acetylglucosamine--N-acetylmuramyl-(pentapeptide) pyrophosphoryl-undecaprenol N-acetylglucosamine transferase [Kiritimatiellota bacterium]